MKIIPLLASLLVVSPSLAEEAAPSDVPGRDGLPAVSSDSVAPEVGQADKAASPALAVEMAPIKPRPTDLDTPVARPKFPPVPQEDTKTEGLIPGILFGPKLSIISLPTPALGVEVKAYQLFGASFDYGFIPDFKAGSVTLGMKTWNVGAKVYPMRGAFFLGASLGGYTFTGKSTVSDVNGQPVAAKLDISATFIAPEIGWRWVWTSGFFTGLELGWQFPLNYKSTLDVPGGASSGSIKDVRDNADKYVKSGLPMLGLFELGWFF